MKNPDWCLCFKCFHGIHVLIRVTAYNCYGNTFINNKSKMENQVWIKWLDLFDCIWIPQRVWTTRPYMSLCTECSESSSFIKPVSKPLVFCSTQPHQLCFQVSEHSNGSFLQIPRRPSSPINLLKHMFAGRGIEFLMQILLPYYGSGFILWGFQFMSKKQL